MLSVVSLLRRKVQISILLYTTRMTNNFSFFVFPKTLHLEAHINKTYRQMSCHNTTMAWSKIKTLIIVLLKEIVKQSRIFKCCWWKSQFEQSSLKNYFTLSHKVWITYLLHYIASLFLHRWPREMLAYVHLYINDNVYNSITYNSFTFETSKYLLIVYVMNYSHREQVGVF